MWKASHTMYQRSFHDEIAAIRDGRRIRVNGNDGYVEILSQHGD
ncbi:hypothetical protein [Nocardia sp.]|nr:hypothetical protein [Nocardia sp.]